MSILTALLSTSLSMSAVALLVLAANRLAATRIRASFRYYAWLVVLVGFILPYKPVIAPFRIPIGFETVVSPLATQGDIQNETNEANMPDFESDPFFLPQSGTLGAGVAQMQAAIAKPALSLVFIPLGTWMAVAIGVIAYHLLSYLRFTSSVRRWGTKVMEGPAASALKTVMSEMGLGDTPVTLKTCTFVSSPMLIGFFSPIILLPDGDVSPDELNYAMRHELAHYIRRDTWINLLILLVSALHWFNPLVYLITKAIRTDCEAACDEAVVKGYCTEQRREYGESILGFIGTARARNPVLSTYYFSGSKSIKSRLFAIMDTGRKSNFLATTCLTLAIAATALSGSVLGKKDSSQNIALPQTAALGEAMKTNGYLSPILTLKPTALVTANETRSFPLKSGGRLKVSTVFGNIKLISWDKDEVRLLASFSPGTDGEHASIEAKGGGNSLELIVKVPPMPINRGNGDIRGAKCDMELMVPSHINGNIDAVNGGIELHSISGTTRLEAINGSILLENVSGNLDASSLNGSILGSIGKIEKNLVIDIVNGEGKVKLLNPNGVFAISSINGSIALAIDPETQNNNAKTVSGKKSPNLKFSAVNGSIIVQ